MKKEILFFALVFILIIPSVSSVEITGKSTLQKGETFVVQVSGNFVNDIQKSNIMFYRRHMPTSIANYDLVKIEGKYYIYAKVDLEKIPDNYSMKISGVSYIQGTQTLTNPIIYNFTIINQTTDFWIYPGALITDKNFTIEVQNLQESTIIITIDKINESEENGGWTGWFSELFGGGDETTNEEEITIELMSGEIKNIPFALINETRLREIKLSSTNTEYYVPVYNIYNPGPINNETNQTQINNTDNNESQGNNTEINITDLNITEPDLIIEITDENGTIIPIDEAKQMTCEELGGENCPDKEGNNCTGEIFYAKTRCCLHGTCEIKEKSNTGKIIGWIIIVAVALIVAVVLKKNLKKSGKPINLLSVGKK